MQNKKQTQAKRKIKRNFFQEAVIRELNLGYRRQRSEQIKRGIQRKKLLTSGKVAL